MATPAKRALATILVELDGVRRHLREAPPHQASAREGLLHRLRSLERELAAARAEAARSSHARSRERDR